MKRFNKQGDPSERMKRLYPTCLMVMVICVYPSFAQSGNSDRCEMVLTDVKTGKSTGLGTFTTVIAEEQLTTRVFRLPGRSLSWAEAEMPLNGFDVGRVSLMVRINRHRKMVVMECRKGVRR